MREFQQAAQELTAARMINPDNLELSQLLSVALLQSGQVDQATALLQQVVSANPTNGTAWFFLGNARSQAGQFREAISAYRQAIEVAPSLLEAANNLAWMLSVHPDAQLRSGEEALALSQQLCRISQFKEPQFLDTLAVAYAETGQFAKAAEAARKALALIPDGPAEREIRDRLSGFEQGKAYRETRWATP